jgi:hypothetical protein
MSVKDAQLPHPVQRRLLVSREVVQIRLSMILATSIAVATAFLAKLIFGCLEPLDSNDRALDVPGHQFAWTVQAAREKTGEPPSLCSSAAFAIRYPNLNFVAPDVNHLNAWIENPSPKSGPLSPSAVPNTSVHTFTDRITASSRTSGDRLLPQTPEPQTSDEEPTAGPSRSYTRRQPTGPPWGANVEMVSLMVGGPDPP